MLICIMLIFTSKAFNKSHYLECLMRYRESVLDWNNGICTEIGLTVREG